MAEKLEGRIQSLDRAMFQIEADLFDAAIPGGKLVVTVHQRGGQGKPMRVYTNTWIFTLKGQGRMIPEHEFTDLKPSREMLLGETGRFANLAHETLEGDIHLKLAAMTLVKAASREIAKFKERNRE